MHVPFKVGSKKDYKNAHSNHEINTRIEDAPFKLVKLDNLVAIQGSVHADEVARYIDNPERKEQGERHTKHGGLVDMPIVIRKNGREYIHDGHHRLTAAKLSGDSSSRVRFVDFDLG